MTFFTKPAITFVAVNLLRVLSVVAICLAFSGELVVMVTDIKGYENQSSLSTTSTTSSSNSNRFLIRREHLDLDVAPHRDLARTDLVRVLKREVESYSSRARSTASATTKSASATAILAPISQASSTATSTASTETASAAEASATTCSYIGNTSIPKTTGGVLFSTLERILVCIICLFMLVAEMPPPSQWTQRFWAYGFPPYGDHHGVGVLGITQLFVGCSMLSKSVTGITQVGGWFLFIVAFLNILFGLAYGSKIKEIRSIFSLPGGHQRGRPFAKAGEPPAGSHVAPSSYYSNGPGETTEKVQGIRIGRPIVIAPRSTEPPTYGRSNTTG
ncbi:hypothetical protein RQP46_008123 [Phenoliferia psychrophenolica]